MPYSDWQLAQLPQIDPAIVRAAVNGDVAAVRQWLDDGNDPNLRYDVIGNGDVVIVGSGETLLHEVASDSITYRDRDLDTEAVERGRCDIARLLLARGAVPDPLRVGRDSYARNTPLFLAAIYGREEMCELLCAAGADPEREPTREEKNEDGTSQTLVLGKSAHALATEMANDISNPLHLDAKTMLQVMAEPDEAKRRVMALQARLEEQVALEVRSASRNIAVIVTGMVCVGVLHWYFGILDPWINAQGNDPREL